MNCVVTINREYTTTTINNEYITGEVVLGIYGGDMCNVIGEALQDAIELEYLYTRKIENNKDLSIYISDTGNSSNLYVVTIKKELIADNIELAIDMCYGKDNLRAREKVAQKHGLSVKDLNGYRVI